MVEATKSITHSISAANLPDPDLSFHRLINTEQLLVLLPVSRMTVWRLEKRGLLPSHIRIGGRNYWRLSAVLEALERISTPAASNREAPR